MGNSTIMNEYKMWRKIIMNNLDVNKTKKIKARNIGGWVAKAMLVEVESNSDIRLDANTILEQEVNWGENGNGEPKLKDEKILKIYRRQSEAVDGLSGDSEGYNILQTSFFPSGYFELENKINVDYAEFDSSTPTIQADYIKRVSGAVVVTINQYDVDVDEVILNSHIWNSHLKSVNHESEKLTEQYNELQLAVDDTIQRVEIKNVRKVLQEKGFELVTGAEALDKLETNSAEQIANFFEINVIAYDEFLASDSLAVVGINNDYIDVRTGGVSISDAIQEIVDDNDQETNFAYLSRQILEYGIENVDSELESKLSAIETWQDSEYSVPLINNESTTEFEGQEIHQYALRLRQADAKYRHDVSDALEWLDATQIDIEELLQKVGEKFKWAKKPALSMV